MLSARAMIAVSAGGFASLMVQFAGSPNALQCRTSRVWAYRYRLMPTWIYPLMKHWRNASSYFASGAAWGEAAWLCNCLHLVTTVGRSQFVTSFIRLKSLLIFLCENSRCGAHLPVFAWNAATFPVRRMRTLTLSRDGMAPNPCHPALQRLTALKSHFKNSGTYSSRFSCFPVINTFCGRFPQLICWGRQ